MSGQVVSRARKERGCSLLPPEELKCEHAGSPMAVQEMRPRLSWELRSPWRGAGQTAFRVLAASSLELLLAGTGDVWDSGKIESAQPHAPYAGSAPVSGRRVHWRVMLWDEEDRPSDWSDPAYFEFGILSPSEWRGEWIGAGDIEAAPYLRREFNARGPVRRARAYFSGLGFGELYVNGFRVGEGKFLPAWTDYDRREYRDLAYPYDDQSRKRVLYVAHDVTALLRVGRNALGCVLGNGMHNQRVRLNEGKMWYGPPRMLLDLVVEYEDGSVERIGSDLSWKWSEGPLLFNNLFVGEIYDARRELSGAWAMPDFDDSSWRNVLSAPCPMGEMCGQVCPADTVVGTLLPVARGEPRPGVHVFDFGRIISGWVKIAARGPAGTRIVLRFSEQVKDDGTLDTRSVGADIVQQDEFILAGTGVETYEPRFVWHAFRYVEITGWPGTPSAGEVEAKIVHADTPATGEFACSSQLLDKIVALFRATQLANQHGGVPSDCPHRERLGYTGDGQITAEAVMWNFQAAPFYAKWIDDIFDAQNQASGFVPHTAPFYGGGGGPGWGSAAIIVPWQFYRFYGDARVLEKNYAGMAKWVEYLEKHADKRGLVTTEEPGSWCLGDWAVPTSLADDAKPPMVPCELVNTFYFGHCAELMRRIAGILGRKADVAKYGALAEKIRVDFHREFYDPKSGSYAGGVGGADAFALLLGATPKADRETAVAALIRDSRRLDTGIFGTPTVLEALMENGGAARACEIMSAETYPSFGYMIASGATAIWESWSGTFGSHCHPMFGSVAAWMYKWVAGLNQAPDSSGFDKLTWRPWRGPELEAARLSFRSVRGLIALEWERSAGALRARISLPPGSRAEILLPRSGAGDARALHLDGQALTGNDTIPGVVRTWKTDHDFGVEILSGDYEFNLL